MDGIGSWIGDVRGIPGLARPVADLVCLLASVACGIAVGLEREHRDKPAGLRTVLLICLGSTVFTLVSLLLGERKPTADPARLAAQIVSGIGFIGAGAILRSHGTVHGLTTAATIWAVAAVGVTLGAGYVVPGIVFTATILIVLTLVHRLGALVIGSCEFHRVTVTYRPNGGKAWPRLQEVLDQYQIRDADVSRRQGEGTSCVVEARVCTSHRDHRSVLADLANLPDVLRLDG